MRCARSRPRRTFSCGAMTVPNLIHSLSSNFLRGPTRNPDRRECLHWVGPLSLCLVLPPRQERQRVPGSRAWVHPPGRQALRGSLDLLLFHLFDQDARENSSRELCCLIRDRRGTPGKLPAELGRSAHLLRHPFTIASPGRSLVPFGRGFCSSFRTARARAANCFGSLGSLGLRTITPPALSWSGAGQQDQRRAIPRWRGRSEE